MPRYLALLRGINVSGKNSIKMEDLRNRLQQAGFTRVQTLIQSGNIVFEHTETSAVAIRDAVAKLITDAYGYVITVLVVTGKELAAAVAGNPFCSDAQPEPSGFKKLHVTFLSETPAEEHMEKLRQSPIGNDRIELTGNVLYFQLETKTSDSKLSNALVESKLKVKATTRNWNTTLKLLELMESYNDHV